MPSTYSEVSLRQCRLETPWCLLRGGREDRGQGLAQRQDEPLEEDDDQVRGEEARGAVRVGAALSVAMAMGSLGKQMARPQRKERRSAGEVYLPFCVC